MGIKMSSQSYLKGYGNINIESINREYEKEKVTKRKSYQKKKVANSHMERYNKKEEKRKELERLSDEYRRMRFDYKLNHNLTDFQVCSPLPSCVKNLLVVYNSRIVDPLNEISFDIINESVVNIVLLIPNKREKIIIHYDTSYMKPITFTVKDKSTGEKHSYKVEDDDSLIVKLELYMIKLSNRTRTSSSYRGF